MAKIEQASYLFSECSLTPQCLNLNILRYLPELEAAFKARDPSDTGFVTQDEFKDAFASLGEDKVSLDEANFFFMGKDEKVDYKDWIRVKTVSRDNNAPPLFTMN